MSKNFKKKTITLPALALRLGENLMKIRPKIVKLQIFLHSHIDAYIHEQSSENSKWRSSSFRPNLVFPILMAKMVFSQIRQTPGPDLEK